MSDKLKKIPRYFLTTILLAINAVCVAGMLACAYSVYLPPQRFPSVSYFGMIFPLFLALTVLFLLFWLVFGWRWVWLSLLGLLLSADAVRTFYPLNWPKAVPDGALKVLSYNVQQFGLPDDRQWFNTPVVNYILASNADIVCLQESEHMDDAKVDSVLATVYPYRQYVSYNHDAFGCLSKYPIVAYDTINYVSKSNASVCFDIVVDGDTLLVLNNHMESYKLLESDKAEYKEIIKQPRNDNTRQNIGSLTAKLTAATAIRGAQADSVAAYIDCHRQRSIIACGDLNDVPVSYVHHRLTSYLNDAFTRSGNGVGYSYNRSAMYFRIDNILYSPDFKAYGARVDQSIKESDHYPIFCWLKKQ